MEKSDDSWSFLEEQKLMKIDKTKEELIQIFERNIANEYVSHITKK